MPNRRQFAAGLTALVSLAAFPALAQGGGQGGGQGTAGGSALRGVAGTYELRGLNFDGTEYYGQARLEQQGATVRVFWRVSRETYTGEGRIDGRVLTVDWGAEDPIVYVLMPDGELHGTWADGRALEKLSPN